MIHVQVKNRKVILSNHLEAIAIQTLYNRCSEKGSTVRISRFQFKMSELSSKE